MRNIVLLAPLGQVGFELLRSLAPLGTVFTLSRSDIDFADTAATATKVAALKPDLIVNAAAWTAVDKAETERDAAFLINAALPAALASVAQQHNAWLVHYSTDYVYPGNGDKPWQETDTTGPLSVYGQSKLAGDEAIIARCPRHIIFRTSWVYAARGTNFMRTMLKLAQSREALNVVADQMGAPTPARLIAQVSALALQQLLTQDTANTSRYAGVYHLAARGYCSWYDFAAEIFSLARANGLALALNPEQFKPITTPEYPTPATRPANSRLDVTKLERQFALQLPDWRSQLKLVLSEWQILANGE
ncbi:dTDP-4-dehydrorhamnose reductase [Rheinheimera maricola]|uniref:dTDP-4-dehydrorhamnose reductase n=1 Tax=Rheinheimera maricola TaxID=2793282 RepID=A0ABS7X6R2_9GAMM|nr:dTDP-4-dehydrorhamnose reductase [Rheinheimera maricola]MBZ9610307.1 dTDP-4-dehydrorhamnose reductase [Rheinheimera maricola]